MKACRVVVSIDVYFQRALRIAARPHVGGVALVAKADFLDCLAVSGERRDGPRELDAECAPVRVALRPAGLRFHLRRRHRPTGKPRATGESARCRLHRRVLGDGEREVELPHLVIPEHVRAGRGLLRLLRFVRGDLLAEDTVTNPAGHVDAVPSRQRSPPRSRPCRAPIET